jgi:hypothetical protein
MLRPRLAQPAELHILQQQLEVARQAVAVQRALLASVLLPLQLLLFLLLMVVLLELAALGAVAVVVLAGHRGLQQAVLFL